MHTVLWKRLDRDGHDACRFTKTHDTWNIEGSAVFEHNGSVADLAYRLVCDSEWCSVQASVTGSIGSEGIELLIERDGVETWRVNGSVREDLAGLKDIDLGFTPASNTSAIRRLNLCEGCEARSTAVWLDTEDGAVKPLPQIYRRIGRNAYDYTSLLHDYRATLTVDDFGVVAEYPRLWVMVRTGGKQ